MPLPALRLASYLLLAALALPACAVKAKPPRVKDGKEYGVTDGFVWSPSWWNFYKRGALKTPDGKYIWAETVPGTVYEEKAFPDLYQKLFDSMFQNSFQAIRSAPEIGAFAAECERVPRQSQDRTEPRGPRPLS